MRNPKKTQLATLLAISTAGLAAAAPAFAADSGTAGDEVGPGGLPKKLLLVYKHTDDAEFPTEIHSGPTNVMSKYTRSFALVSRIPLTLSNGGAAKGSAPLKYTKMEYKADVTTTTDGEDLHCENHEIDTVVSAKDSTAKATLKVGRAKGKRKIGPITLVFNPGRPEETVHITDKNVNGGCPSAGEYDRQENQYLGAFAEEWGSQWNDLTGNLTVKTIKPHRGVTLGSGLLSTDYPGLDSGNYQDKFVLLKR